MLESRLSKDVIPINYNLTLHPDFETDQFYGSVIIRVDIRKSAKTIYFHTKHLDLSDVSVCDYNGTYINVKGFQEDLLNEYLVIDLNDTIKPGLYSISVEFGGSLRNKLVGLYLSTFQDKKLVSSKFEPTYARQAFPCFDEPDFKATYDIKLAKPKDYIALSNMNELSTNVYSNETNTDLVTFATSVPMSTYLACFVICDFVYIEDTVDTKSVGKPFILRSYSRKDQTNKIEFSQDIGKRATEFYIQYYQVPFPLPKLDMIAIPNYASGATEHWGLITYRETQFLIDKQTSSTSNMMSVAKTVTHELAHMWFGNLVTMKWWDDLWLNEAFATYMQYKSLHNIEPTWKYLDQFLTNTMHPVLKYDDKISSHPIVQKADTPDEINSLFDVISYNKGSSVLRMLEGFVGEENFRHGVTDYLKKFQFSNTITKDLLDSLEQYCNLTSSGLTLSHVMDTWTRQSGYPLLTVTVGKKPNNYIVTQRRFLIDGDAKYDNDSPYNYRWCVPITYKTAKGNNATILWFKDTDNHVTIQLDEKDEWLKINNDQVGYYRTTYPENMWTSLIDQLVHGQQLTISDRAHLLEEVYQLASARVVSYPLALKLIQYLSVEKEYVPWSAAAVNFADLKNKLYNTTAADNLNKFVLGLISPLYSSFSWKHSETVVVQKLLRVQILQLACEYGMPDALMNARLMLQKWLTDQTSVIEPDLRNIVYYFGMKEATPEEWNQMWTLYLNEVDPQERGKLMRALAAPKDTSLLEKYLELAWDENYIRSQDHMSVLSFVSTNSAGIELAWTYFREKWLKFVNKFTLNSRYLGNVIQVITSRFDTTDRLKEVEEFYRMYPDAGTGSASRKQAMENLKNNIKWAQYNKEIVDEWLKNNV